MNLKTFLSALSDSALKELESALCELKTEKEESNELLFCDWVEQNKSRIPEMTYRAFVRNFRTLDKRFIEMPVHLVDSKFIHKFKGIGKVQAFNFLQLFPEFDR